MNITAIEDLIFDWMLIVHFPSYTVFGFLSVRAWQTIYQKQFYGFKLIRRHLRMSAGIGMEPLVPGSYRVKEFQQTLTGHGVILQLLYKQHRTLNIWCIFNQAFVHGKHQSQCSNLNARLSGNKSVECLSPIFSYIFPIIPLVFFAYYPFLTSR